jgi:hypothetical protein
VPVVVMLEALAFGLDGLARAARRADAELVLLTFDRPYYERGLAGAPGITVLDVDTFDIGAVRTALDGLRRVDGLISNTDTWAVTAETLAAERGYQGVLRNAARLRDKAWVRQRLAAAGLSTLAALRAPQWLALPAGDRPENCVVKDASGTSSRDVLLGGSAAEIETLIGELAGRGLPPGRIVVEPYLRGPVYSAETCTTTDGTTLLGISGRTISELPDFREIDVSYPVAPGSAWAARVARWAAGVLAAVGRGTGLSHLEFIDTGASLEVVEVNSRLGGWLIGTGIELVTGVSPYDLLVSQALAPRLTGAALERAAVPPRAAGFAQVAKYAGCTGPLGPVLGCDDLGGFPGDVAWHPILDPGDVVPVTTDQRAAYGIVTASGSSAGEALCRVRAAARQVRLASGQTCR